MRNLEILLILLCLLDGITRVRTSGNRPIWISALPLVAFFFGIVHAAAEGIRWQMVPAYITVLATFTAVLVRTFNSEPADTRHNPSGWAGWLIIGLSTISVMASTALPVYTIPPTQGDYGVGRRTITLQPSGAKAWVHYPTDRPGTGGRTVAYPEDERARFQSYLTLTYGVPETLLGHLNLIETQTRPDTDLSAELPRFRVLIVKPDSSSSRFAALSLTEDLASRGFVVVTIPQPADDEQTLTPENIVEQLESLDPSADGGWLADRMDLARVGLLGYWNTEPIAHAADAGSFRAAAVLGAITVQPDVSVPMFYLIAEGHEGPPVSDTKSVTYACSVRGALIDNFTDHALVSPFMPTLGHFGSIDPERATHITRAYVGAFFNKHLTRGTVEELLDGPSTAFPEVAIQIHDPRE